MYLDNHQGWHVVFCKSTSDNPIVKRLKGWQHCFCMAKSPGGSYWIIVNPAWQNITITMIFSDEYPTPESYCEEHFGSEIEVIPYHAKIESDKSRLGWLSGYFGFLNCVSVTRRVLGIDKLFFTPDQLCRYLKNELK